MKKGKRILAWATVLSMGLAVAGCGKQDTITTEGTTAEATTEATTEEATESLLNVNQIQNGDFSNELSHWSIYTNGGSGVQVVNAEQEMELMINSVGTLTYSIQPYYDGFALSNGGVYELSFDVHATIERPIEWRIQMNGGDYRPYASDIITVNEEVQHITATFTMNESTDPAPRLCLNLGNIEGCPADMGQHSIYFDNFELYLRDDTGIVISDDTVETAGINVNQVGYLPDVEKKAVVRAEEGTEITGSFDVVNVETDEVIYTGELENSMVNKASEEQTAIADFTEVTKAGTYKIVTENYGESFAFEIGDDVYDEVTDSVMRMFYLQRCGEEITDDAFGHVACHTGTAVIYGDESGTTVAVDGGWHDAGDYGRYTVAGAKAAVDLMLTYEAYGDVFGDDFGIPESGNGTPDILDEAKYELDWMLMMQDPATGGVYHKITCENFPETVMPEEEVDQLILAPISTTATADFAATMAMASRVYADIDADFANQCLAAAEKAWGYLEVTPNDGLGFKNPGSIVTGAYDDGKDGDERYWALAELYKATGNEKYLTELKTYPANGIGGGLGWQSVGLYGMYTYLTCGDSSDEYYQTIEDRFYQAVDKVIENSEADAYSVSLAADGYCWGSNMQVVNNGMLLLMANQLKPSEEYVVVARQQLDYILGTNTNSYCFVTGFGTLSPENPHHRPSQALGTAMEGMLIGGPDSALEDPYAKATLTEKANAACYVDNAQSYSCNEVTIYWNSPLVYLLAGLDAE